MSSIPTAIESMPGDALFGNRLCAIEAVERALQAGGEAAGRVEEVDAVLLRCVPGKRSAFRLDLTLMEDNRTARRRVLAKVYHKEQGARAYEVVRDLRARGFGDGTRRVPKPLGYDPASRLLLLEWVDGVLLRDRVLEGLPAMEEIKRAGAWLAALHGCGTGAGRAYSFQRHLHTLRGWADRIAGLCPAVRPRLAGLLRWVERRGEALRGWKPGPTHRDFSPDHLLFAGPILTGLDFDEFCQYDPLFDVAHFIAHLRLLAPGRSGPLAKGFLAAYRANAREYSEERIAFYTAISHFKLAHITAAVTRPPDWERRLSALLAAAGGAEGEGSPC